MSQTAVESLSGAKLVGAAVRWRGVRLGHAVDLLLDRDVGRVVGFEVDCGNGQRRFLTLAACTVTGTELALTSPHALVDAAGLSFYRDHSASLLELLGSRLDRRGHVAGVLEDVLLGPEGEVERLVLRRGEARVVLPPAALDGRSADE